MKALVQIVGDFLLNYYRLVPLFDEKEGLVCYSGFVKDGVPDVRKVDFMFDDKAKTFGKRLKSYRKKGLPLRSKEHYRDVVEMTEEMKRRCIEWLFEI